MKKLCHLVFFSILKTNFCVPTVRTSNSYDDEKNTHSWIHEDIHHVLIKHIVDV